jgi:hypothetical protein
MNVTMTPNLGPEHAAKMTDQSLGGHTGVVIAIADGGVVRVHPWGSLADLKNELAKLSAHIDTMLQRGLAVEGVRIALSQLQEQEQIDSIKRRIGNGRIVEAG